MERKDEKKPKYEKPVAVDLKTSIVNGGMIDTTCPGGDTDVPTTCKSGYYVLAGG